MRYYEMSAVVETNCGMWKVHLEAEEIKDDRIASYKATISKMEKGGLSEYWVFPIRNTEGAYHSLGQAVHMVPQNVDL